ncbi:MAG: alpha/beta hydrolase [Bacilli bacterium]|nr:alpha/beta hydrolase [Bacilli bacterium]
MYLTVKDITIYYEKHGNSKNTILILPGWGNTRETFHHIINNFKNNYTIYILDYPGLGNSPIPNKTLTIYDYTEIIIDFMEKLNIINPIIIAHSFGGRITSLLTGYYKHKVEKLILIDIAGIKPKKTLKKLIKEKIYKLKKKIIKLFPKKKQNYLYQKLLKKYASPDYLSLPPTMHETFKNIVNEDLTKHFKNIKEETLLIWGENDQDTPLQDAYKIKSLIKNSALIILKNGNHYSYLNYPILVNNIIYEFIKKEHY